MSMTGILVLPKTNRQNPGTMFLLRNLLQRVLLALVEVVLEAFLSLLQEAIGQPTAQNLWLLVSQRCRIFVIQLEDGGFNSNLPLVLYPILTAIMRWFSSSLLKCVLAPPHV